MAGALHGMIDWTRRVPVRYEADVAVIGGGMAGVGAACAAAKSGARVILLERFAVTGGAITVGGVANFCGEWIGQGEVYDEMVAAMEAFGAISAPRVSSPLDTHRIVDHEILAFVLQELLLRAGVKLLLHTRFVDVRVDGGGRISECVVCGSSGAEALRAGVFIDCTGEANVARAAGFETIKGRPADGLQLPMSVMGFVREMSEPVAPQVPAGWIERIESEADLPMVSPWPAGTNRKALKVKIPRFDSTDTESLTAAEVHARRRLMAVVDYFQRRDPKRWRYDGCSPLIGIREGARVVGDYVLVEDDLRRGRTFEDGVARGTYYLDAHDPTTDKRVAILPEAKRGVPPYQIPLRSLIARDGVNLLMAGRCFSADQMALSSARVAPTCAMMGQAAGITAALAVHRACAPRDVDPADVRRIVLERGAVLDC